MSPCALATESFLEMSFEELFNVTVSTSSRRLEPISKAPATVHIITQQQIHARGYTVLTDLLKDLPGIEVIEHGFSEWGGNISVRGVTGNNKVILLVDGMRVNPPGGENLPIKADLSVRCAKQVEVNYGPSSTLYGQDAMNLVINIVHANEKQRENTVALTLGENEFVEAFTALHWSSTGSQNLYGDLSTDQQNHLRFWYRESERSSSEGGYAGILHYVDEAVWKDRGLVVQGEHCFILSANTTLNSLITYNRYEIDPNSRYVFIAGDELYLNDYKYGVYGVW